MFVLCSQRTQHHGALSVLLKNEKTFQVSLCLPTKPVSQGLFVNWDLPVDLSSSQSPGLQAPHQASLLQERMGGRHMSVFSAPVMSGPRKVAWAESKVSSSTSFLEFIKLIHCCQHGAPSLMVSTVKCLFRHVIG